MKAYIAEFLGTFFLVLSICLTGHPLIIGGVLIACIYLGGPISGAHYNPVVTFSVYLLKKIHLIKGIGFILLQLLAAISAAALSFWMLPQPVVPAVASDASFGMAFIAEVMFTFLMVWVIFMVAHHPKTMGNQYYGVAIGAAVIIGIYAVGAISGAVFNPAVGTGPLVMDFILTGNLPKDLLLYYVGPLTGGVIATLFFQHVQLKRLI